MLVCSSVFNMKTHDGLTPLLVAAKYNRKNAVLWLLQTEEAEVDTDVVDESGQNALHLAAQHMECEYTIEVFNAVCCALCVVSMCVVNIHLYCIVCIVSESW